MGRSLAIALSLALVAACTATTPPGQQQGGTPQRGGTVVRGTATDIQTLQPILAADDASEITLSNFYEGLLRLDPATGVLEPGLAEKWEVSPDGLTYTFTLRDGLVWSDGTPFTGEDYRYTAEATIRAKRGIRKAIFGNVAGVRDYAEGKADSISGITVSGGGKTITVKTVATACRGPQLLGNAILIIPKHKFVSGWDNKTTDITKTIDDHPMNNAPPAAMGPFVFKEYRTGVQVSMTRNDRYYRGAPLIDEFIVKVYSSPAAVKAALLGGELTFALIQPGDVEEVQRTGGNALNFHRVKSTNNYTSIGWNAKSPKAPWLAVKEVRQALWYGLNVKQIIDKVLFGYGHQVYAHTPQSSWAYDESGLNKYEYSVAKAKELLEKAGARMGNDGVYRWSDGKVMEMRIDAPAPAQPIVEVAQDQYRQIGIKIQPNILAAAALSERTQPPFLDREGTLGNVTFSPDPDAWHLWHSSRVQAGQFNSWHYSNPEVDRATLAGRDGPDCSVNARKANYKVMNQNLNADAPVTFLFAPDQLYFSSKNLQGFDPKGYSPVTYVRLAEHNIEKWSVKR